MEPRNSPTGENSVARISLFARHVFGSRVTQLVIAELILIAIFFSLSDGMFLNAANVRGMLIAASQIMLIAIGQAVLMAAGHIDISQGAAIVLTAVIAGQGILWIREFMPLSIALLVGLIIAVASGALVGLVNGVMAGIVGINSLVATLGMLGIASGLALVLTRGVNLIGLPRELNTLFGVARWGALPIPFLFTVGIILIIWFLFRFTAWGTHVLAMGSNLRSAHRVGINTPRDTIGVFILSSSLAGVAGFIDLARYSTTNISGHTSAALAAIAAALIGGTLLTGGRINFMGATLGALLAIILSSGLVIINISPFYQTIVIGIMLLVAVSLDPQNRKLRGTQ